MSRLTHPDRERLFTALENYLATYPDIRLGQAIVNATVAARLVHCNPHLSAYYAEDGKLADGFEYLENQRAGS